MKTKIGINGFGRIGRQVLKAIKKYHSDEFDVVAINDLYDSETNARLFKYDSNYGIYTGTVEVIDGNIVIDGDEIKVFAERDPGNLPWKELGVDIVIESTGVFKDTSVTPGPQSHIQTGAKKVVISAPAKGEDLTVVLGVNHELYDPAKHHIISNASCTTNCLAPPVKVIHEKFGIVRGLMTTIHSYTTTQRILDLAHKNARRSRAAALNIIPTTTGAAVALSKVIPAMKGKFDGFALRVPTPTVSIVDIVVELEKSVTIEEVNQTLKTAAEGELRGIMGYTEELLVSMDYKGNPLSSIIDSDLTNVMGGNMVKIVTWYDNEWGYSCRTADMAALLGKNL
ncbi:MAG: type I glyceraldehyde-3-phosphate dehydrogenase [Chloroflexota bacterium]|nr:MAG: type I glyceraldehyde-3-phosphate dehydrogenase [Chloroflexota bacterium]